MFDERLDHRDDLLKQLRDWRLTTAEILYRLPDHPSILQAYVWQDYDIAPRFPVLQKFLGFWERELDGKLFRVNIADCKLITSGDFRAVSHEFYLN